VIPALYSAGTKCRLQPTGPNLRPIKYLFVQLATKTERVDKTIFLLLSRDTCNGITTWPIPEAVNVGRAQGIRKIRQLPKTALLLIPLPQSQRNNLSSTHLLCTLDTLTVVVPPYYLPLVPAAPRPSCSGSRKSDA